MGKVTYMNDYRRKEDLTKLKTYLNTEFESVSENEALARMIISAFVARLNPTVEEVEEIKTAVSEAVTNAVIHGYPEKKGNVKLFCSIDKNELTVIVEDKGVGIEDIKKAMEPLYSSKPDEERSGMGFSFMEIFMDELTVDSVVNQGTTVIMKKKIQCN